LTNYLKVLSLVFRKSLQRVKKKDNLMALSWPVKKALSLVQQKMLQRVGKKDHLMAPSFVEEKEYKMGLNLL